MASPLSIRIDQKLKTKAMSRARGEGSTLTHVVNAFLALYAEGAFKMAIVPAPIKPYPSDMRSYAKRKKDLERGKNIVTLDGAKMRLNKKR